MAAPLPPTFRSPGLSMRWSGRRCDQDVILLPFLLHAMDHDLDLAHLSLEAPSRWPHGHVAIAVLPAPPERIWLPV
ncbi:hypothetical protein ABT246_42935 [Streptomyces sp. NPDC001553]|uniref:hypothetical protein n=1 Tax=Streptomyces sp. NPDC001553 TaxID=3154385 RepID=UPI00331F7C62